MKIMHTSDLHLGKRLHQHSLLPDQKHVLDQLVTHIVEQDPDLFIVAGDVFDRSLPPEDAMALFGDWLSTLRQNSPQLPIVIIAGNHDSGKRLAWASRLLNHDKIYLRGIPSTVEDPIHFESPNGERAEVWALPFVWPGDLAQPEGERYSQVGAFQSAIDIIKKNQDSSRRQILVAHCFAQGGTESDSERQLLGQATRLDTQIFEGFEYVALGHLHKPQSLTERVWYSGSPLAYSFTENSDEKGVLLIKLKNGTSEVKKLPLFPLRPMRVIEDNLETLLETEIYDHFRECYLSVRLTEQSILSEPMHHIRERFPHILHLCVPREDAPEAGLSAANQMTGSDLADDLSQFWQHVTGDSPSDEVLLAFDALRPDGGVL